MKEKQYMWYIILLNEDVCYQEFGATSPYHWIKCCSHIYFPHYFLFRAQLSLMFNQTGFWSLCHVFWESLGLGAVPVLVYD